MAEIKVDESNFAQEVLKSPIPVLVDFWATWCGPCRMLAPILTQIAEENDGKIKVCKVNVDDAPEIAGQFGISAIPTVICFREGVPVAQNVGYTSKEALLKLAK